MSLEKNYCGWKGFIPPPKYKFYNASCKIHDENYEIGGNAEDRLRADVGFLKHMLIDINDFKKNDKRTATLWACLYYIGVRSLGWISFNWHKK